MVEDDFAIADTLKEILTGMGYSVDCAADGQLALDYLRDHEVLPDLILLDLMMPNVTGAQFRQAQLLDPRLAGIPAIVLSASQHEAPEGLSIAGWIKKPFSIADLMRAVEAHC